ncbi:MAG: transcriptional regulator [Anaerolineae bacterium]|nr:transcriptional regulator [Anaerolineae bacterium]
MHTQHTNLVFTLTGTDRVGIVEEVTGLFFDLGGNVETSRMVRLGGAFAMLMLVALPSGQFGELEERLQRLTAQGFKVTTQQTEAAHAKTATGVAHHIHVQGADHEGIIHEIAEYLSGHGINIETMDTETKPAPTTGAPLFSMKALVLVPSALTHKDWEEELDEVGQRLNVDIDVTVA